MAENNNEIRLTMSKGKHIASIVICIIIIVTGMVNLLDGDFDLSMIPGIMGVAIVTSLSIFHRIRKIKKAGIDINKYFNFKFEIIATFITYSVFILFAIFINISLRRVLFTLMSFIGVFSLIRNTINYLKKKPMVIVNDYGIKIDFNFFPRKVDMLKWSEVKEVFKYEDTAGEIIGILPQSMKSSLGNRSWLKRFLMGNSKIFTIHQRRISMDINDLYIEIKTRML